MSDTLFLAVFFPSQNAKAGKKQLRNREDDRFDSLVQQYKRKLMGNSAKTPVIKKSKWFSS